VTTLVVSLVTAVVSAVLAGVGTYFAARRELQLKFDESLRELRIEAYKELWKDLEDLAKYGRPDALTNEKAQKLRATLRTWYFHTGGLVLSTDARQDYFTLLDGLELVIGRGDIVLSDEDDEFLRVLGSRLRSAMTRDVGTRRTFIFRGDPERDEPRLERRTYVEDGGTRLLTISSRRRPKLPRRLKLPLTALVSDEPDLDLPDAEVVAWDPGRRALAVRTAGATDADVEERLLLLEDGHIVEGPKGWRRGEVVRRRPSVIWRNNDRPPSSGG
jgi:hypothetical protein